MKKVYLFFFALALCISVWAEPYFVRVNGTKDYAAVAMDEADMQGRTQYKTACIALQAGDVLTCYDQGNSYAWAIAALDPYGACTQFTASPTGLTCNTAGTYDIYIKIQYGNDMWYIEEGKDCGSTPGNPDTPDPTPDPEEPVTYSTSVPSQCTDVMLQAFYWDSYKTSGLKHGSTRWQNLSAESGEIAAYFDLVWLPPSAKASGVGYHPAQYCNQNSAWGSRADLETLIANLHAGGTKVIADIVINHTDNKSSWCDFYQEDFGKFGSFSPDASWICKTDEMNSDASAGTCKGKATGAADDGNGSEANYAAARDWDHQNAEVRKMFCAYLQWMKNEMHYDGWRYDYCKGFHNSHINEYNKAAGDGYAIWVKTTQAVAPKLVVTPGSTTFKTETLQIAMETIGGTETAEIYYTIDGTNPKTSATRIAAGSEVSFTINNTTTLMAYARTASTETAVQTYEYTRKEPQTTPIIVSFYKPASWAKLYLYAWTGSTTTILGKWPGTELTLQNANGFYFYQFDATIKEVNFIFNGGSGKEQTSDLWTDEDVCYVWSAGAEKLQPDCIYTALDETEYTPAKLDLNAPMYNILGMPVDATYRGIVIQNGHKFLLR